MRKHLIEEYRNQKSFDRKPKKSPFIFKDTGLTVYVREGNVDRALGSFKKESKECEYHARLER